MKKFRRRYYRDKRGRFVPRLRVVSRRKKRHVQRRKVLPSRRQKTHPRRLPKRIHRRASRKRVAIRPRRRAHKRPHRKRRVVSRLGVTRRVISRREVTRRPVPSLVSGKWEKTKNVINRLYRKWGIEEYRSDRPASFLKWFLSGQKWLAKRRAYPSERKGTLYAVFYGWYVVFNEEDEEYYLWSRRDALTRDITVSDLMKAVRRDKRLRHMPYQKAILHLPISVRAPRGMTWAEVLKAKAGRIAEQIESIEDDPHPTSQSPGGYYKVKEFVGWSVYPVVGSQS